MIRRQGRRKNKGFHVTLEDIAGKLKVSKVTVSKALRGHPDISANMALRIKETARGMGYYPNYVARNLSSRRSNAIGVIVPKIAHQFFSSVIEGIYDAAFQHGYEIILTVSQENAERELKHINSLLSLRVDGLIMSLSQQTQDFTIFSTIKKMGLPITFIDRVPPLEGFNQIVADDRGGAREATRYAIKAGLTRIAHLGGFQHTNIGLERYRGFTDAMKEAKIDIQKEWIRFAGFDESDGYEGFKALMKLGNRPEAIFAVTFPVALGIYRAARELGVIIPEDVDVFCFGNSGLNAILAPRMTYVDQPTRELGRRAFELTLENIQMKDRFVPQQITLPTSLVVRNSSKDNAGPRERP